MLKYVILFISVLFAFHVKAQVAQYSQYYANALYLSPSFAGVEHNSRGILAARYQWPGLHANYLTSTVSVDHYFRSVNSGVGVIVNYDHVNPSNLKTTDIGFSYAYELEISKGLVLRPGIQASFVHKKIDYSDLSFASQYSNNGYVGGSNHEDFQKNSVAYMDFAAGGLLFSEQLWAGFAMHHINRPNQSFLNGESRLPTKFSVFGGYKFMLNPEWKRRYVNPGKEISISPTFMYKAQGKSDQLDLGLYGRYNLLVLGLWYRSIPVKVYSPDKINHDALVFLIGLIYNNFHVGYSFDVTTSKLTMESSGSHEITMSYRINPKRVKKEYQKRPACPSF